MALVLSHEGAASLGECVEGGDDLTQQRPTEPRKFADDQAIRRAGERSPARRAADADLPSARRSRVTGAALALPSPDG